MAGELEGWAARPIPPKFWTGLEQFNAGQFFECHETLEDIWNEEETELRRLYQGILQIGVGFYHALVRRNYRGATVLLAGGIRYLQPFQPAWWGVDIAALTTAAQRALNSLETLGPARIADFDRTLVPKIIFTTESAGNTE